VVGCSALQRRIVAATRRRSSEKGQRFAEVQAFLAFLPFPAPGVAKACALRCRPSLPPAPPRFAQPEAGHLRPFRRQAPDKVTLRRTNKYASGPVPRCRGMVARWHDHLHNLATVSRAYCGLVMDVGRNGSVSIRRASRGEVPLTKSVQSRSRSSSSFRTSTVIPVSSRVALRAFSANLAYPDSG